VTVINPLKHKPVVNNVSFQVCTGEILGIAGVEGNGQTELVESIAGLRKIDRGSILINGQEMTHAGARAMRQAGVSHIPEDRHLRGLVTSYSTAMNAILGDHYRPPYSARFGFLDEGQISAHASRLVKEYDVRPQSITLPAASYSGGNAQKLIVARELARNPGILIAAQPTRGVDIGAIEFIHQQIVKARDLGLAVLLVSADLNEVLSLSDRIIVLYEGAVIGELAQAEATAETVGLLMAGSRLGGGKLEPGSAQHRHEAGI